MTSYAEAPFHRKLRKLEKCSNELKTAEPQPIFTGSYKKKEERSVLAHSASSWMAIFNLQAGATEYDLETWKLLQLLQTFSNFCQAQPSPSLAG